jgi:ribokinase
MHASHPRLCVVGSVNTDLTFRVPRFPQPGETLPGYGFHLGHGGKGANQAVAAARMGAEVVLVAKVGDDRFGESASDNLRSQGVDTAHVTCTPDFPTGTAAVVVDDAARNCIVVVPGANGTLSSEDVGRAAAAVRSARLLLCQLEVPVATSLEAFRLARQAGVTTVLNPAPAVPLPDELIRLSDLCIPNERELEVLTGRPVASLEEVVAAAHVLRQRGPRTVVVTLGGRGAAVVDESGNDHVSGRAVAAVDTSGAGDAFIGSLAVFLAEGLPLRSAVGKANAAAALSVMRPGTQASFPTRAGVEAFHDRDEGGGRPGK